MSTSGRPRPAQYQPAGRRRSCTGGHQLLELRLRGRARRSRARSSGRRGSSAAAQHSCGPEDVRVGRVGDGRLDRPAEDRPRVVGEVVVQRVVAGHEHDQRLLLRPSRPAGLLPQRRERSRVPGQHHGVEPGDVDAQLEGVGGGHAQQVAGRQRALQLASFLGQVATAVGVDPAHEVVPAAVVQQPAGLVGHRLRAPPRPHERQRPGAALRPGRPAAPRRPRRPSGAAGPRARRCARSAAAPTARRSRRAGASRRRSPRLDRSAHQPRRGRGRARRRSPTPARRPARRRTAGRSGAAGAARGRRASRTPRGRRGTRR